MYHIFQSCLQIHGLRCALLAPRNAWVPLRVFHVILGFQLLLFTEIRICDGVPGRAPLPGGRGKMQRRTLHFAASGTAFCRVAAGRSLQRAIRLEGKSTERECIIFSGFVCKFMG